MTKVQIAEDEIITAMDLRKDLMDMGYEVCSLATTGQKAIEIAEKEKPDVIIMDIKLQGEMDGIETAKEISSRFGIHSIFISGFTYEYIKQGFGSNEIIEYLPKPVEGVNLKDAIESLVQEKKGS